MSQFNASARPFVAGNNEQHSHHSHHNSHHNNQHSHHQQPHHHSHGGHRGHASPLPSPHGAPSPSMYHSSSHPSPRGGYPPNSNNSGVMYGGGGASYGHNNNMMMGGNNNGWPTGGSLPSPDMGRGSGARRPPRSDSSNSMPQMMMDNGNGWSSSSNGGRSGGSSPATFRPQVIGGNGGMAKRTVGPIDRSGNNTPVGPKRGPSGGFTGAMERERVPMIPSNGIIGNGSMMMQGGGGPNGNNSVMMVMGNNSVIGPNRSHNSSPSPRPPQPRRNGSTDMTAAMPPRTSNNNNNSNNNMPQGGPLMISVASSGSTNTTSGNSSSTASSSSSSSSSSTTTSSSTTSTTTGTGAPMGSPKTPLTTISTLSKDATTDERHAFYMYEFRTKYCPMFTLYKCEEAKPYTCKQAHYENHLRRKPQMVEGRWTYSANLCVYPSLLDCPDGQSCRLSHRVQKEHIYHPAVYKTQFCDSGVKPDGSGECADYDEHCSKAHGESDLRLPLLDDTGVALRHIGGGNDRGHHRGPSSSGSSHHSRSGSNVSDIIGEMNMVMSSDHIIHGGDDGDGGDPYPRAVIPGSNGIIIGGPMVPYNMSSSRDPSPRASPRLSNRPLTPATTGVPPRNDRGDRGDRNGPSDGHHRRGASNSGMIMSITPGGMSQPSPREPLRTGIPSERDVRDTREMIRHDRDPRDPREMVGISNGATSSLAFSQIGAGRDPRDPREMRGSGAMHERPGSNNINIINNSNESRDPRDPREQRGSGAAPIFDRSSSIDSNSNASLSDDHTGRIYSGDQIGKESLSNSGSGSSSSRPSASSSSSSASTPSLAATSKLQVTSAPFQPMSEMVGSSSSNTPDRQPLSSPPSPLPGSTTSASSSGSSGSLTTTKSSMLSPNSPSFTPSSMLTPTTLPPGGSSSGGSGSGSSTALGMEQEKPDHARYIYGFRVRTCPNFMDTCVSDSYTCFDAHSRIPRRRKPQLQHGRFNYIPTRCRYVLEDKECPQNVHCRFAHGTEEVIYHPSKYKTQLCTHPLDKNGCCAGYGMHCAKAHGEEDRRVPVFETSDDTGGHVTLDDFYDFVCNEPERDAERKFYMYTYKTKKCEGFPWNCQCDGFDWHRPEERRRGPDIKYSPMACPNVKPYLNAEWGDPNIDCTGRRGRMKPGLNGEMPVPDWDCEYAHTLLELMYHPQVYKTGLCDHFDEHDLARWRCVWKRRCAHAHGKADVRSKEDAAEDWRRHTLLHTPATRARLLAATVAQSPRITAETLAARQSPTGSVSRLLPAASAGSGSNTPHASASGTTTPGGSTMIRTFAPRPSSGSNTAASSTTSSPMPFANQGGGSMGGVPSKAGATPRSGSPKMSARSVSGGSYYGDGQPSGNAWSPPPSPPLEAKQQKVGGQWMPLFDLSSSTWSAPMSPPAVPGTPNNPLQSSGSSGNIPASAAASASAASSSSGTVVTMQRVPVLPPSQPSGIWRSESEPSAKMGMSARSSPPQTQTSLRLTIADETGAEWPQGQGQAPGSSQSQPQPVVQGPAPTIIQQPSYTGAGTIVYYKDNILSVGHDGIEVYKGTIKGIGVCVKVLYRHHFVDFEARVHEVDKLLAITEAQELPLLTRYYQKAHVGGSEEHLIMAQQDLIAPGEVSLRDFFLNNPPSTTPEDPVYIRWAQQLLLALQLLHRHGLSHGDLTPTTIFVSKDRSAIRLGDISRLRPPPPKIMPGTPDKEVKEIKLGELLGRQRADMLAAGCLLYSMFTAGLTPFRKEHDRLSYAERLKYGPHPDLDTSMLSASATHLVLNLLVPAEKRFNCEQALRHPMFWSAELNCKLLCCVSNRLLGTGGRHPNQRSISIDEMGRSIPSFLLQVDDDGRAAGHEAQANKGFCAELDTFATSIFPVDPPIWAAHIHDTLLQAIQASGWATLNAPQILGDSAVSLVHFIVACIRFLVLSQQQSAAQSPPPHVICHVHELVRLPHIFASCNNPDRVIPSSMPTPSKLATFPPPLCHVSGGVDVSLLCEGISRYFMPRFPSLTVTLQHLVQKHWRDDVTFAFLDTSLPPLLPYATFRGFVPSSSPPPQIPMSMPTPIGHRPGSAAPSPHLAAAYRVGGPPPPHHMIRERDALTAAQAQAVAAQQQHAMALAQAQAVKKAAAQAAVAEEAMMSSLRKVLLCPFSNENDGHMINDPVMSPCCGESFCRGCVPIYLDFVAGTSISKTGGSGTGSNRSSDSKITAGGNTADRNTPSPNSVKVVGAFAAGGGSSSSSTSTSSTAATPSSPSVERPIKEVGDKDDKSVVASGKSGASTPVSSTPKKSPASSPTAAATASASSSSSSASTSSSIVSSSSSSGSTTATPIIGAAVAPLTPMAALIITDDSKSPSKPMGTCGCGYVLTDDDRHKLPSAPRNQALAAIMHALILAKKVGAVNTNY